MHAYLSILYIALSVLLLAQPRAGVCAIGSGDLLLNENFNQTLNESIWSFDLGDGCDQGLCQWGNGEQQVYTRANVEANANGNLRIVARYEGGKWTSGRISTKGKFTFKYGRVDVRAKLPTADGMFPAIWMMPQHSTYGTWPDSGEIDIAEYQSAWTKDKRVSLQSLHFKKQHGGSAMSFNTKCDPSDWHIYTVMWSPDFIKFMRDNIYIGSYIRPKDATPASWPYNQEFYLILNLAVEPEWGSRARPEGDVHAMEVDWIRVNERLDASALFCHYPNCPLL
ncbi:concanavalin A-like lectin/glucanase domain-containing protein [Syncephalis pseudoplumigaleata]|uniref:Concanavalin A-like lectin/glucanase domain-containing protein n=1 Tax=Syncephalis pseudoplumigaleata TaxID=1712513 RepID=A0A4P9Z625_9FUNG|nr:concanavalin A-like lectin/glucanase domain-containing protein [Syncephalis pseudoplumigaleata]|eukprot:RKP27562.1 concanavalin A-like lectin/glucanase domain-containing protein [Syncephalis pseudoplumigaleata]